MSDRVAPVHLLAGPEAGEKDAFVEKLAADLAQLTGAAPERHRLHAFESRVADIVALLENHSLFASHRLVIVYEAEQVRGKENVDPLLAYLAEPAPDATLVLATDELASAVDPRLLKAIPRDSQRIFWELFENQKQGWVVAFFRRQKISLEPGVVDHILDMVENNTRDLRAECGKLAQYFGAGSTIDLERVEQFLYHGKEENVFTLFDRLAVRDLAAAEEVLEKILLSRGAESEPTALAAGLLWQFRRLAQFKHLLEVENYGLAEVLELKDLKLKGKRNQQTVQAAARNYSRAEVDATIELLVELDTRFRTVKADLHALLLQLAVYSIVKRGGRGAWRLFPATA